MANPTRRRAMLASAAAGAGLLAASGWLAEPRVGYLAAIVIATCGGVLALRGGMRAGVRVPLSVAFVALAIAAGFALRAQVRLYRFSRAPEAVARGARAAQQERLRRAVDEELEALRSIARTGQRLPPDPAEAIARLTHALRDREHRAVLVTRGDTLVVWAGTFHGDVRRLAGASGVVASPFGLTIYAADASGSARTIATSLLYATTPADRLTQGLSQRMSSDEVTEGFAFGPPSDSAPHALIYRDGTRPLFVAQARAGGAEEVRFRLLERARVRVGIALLAAIIAFLIAVSGRDSGALSVVGGALIVLACIALVPLSEFSTRSRLFDAGVFYFPAGRAFTANAAALALSSATILLLVLLGVRRVGRHVPRGVAIGVAVATIAAGPFAVRTLSRGITPPPDGANGSLWIIWSVPLTLAATALLVLAAWAGRRTLGGRRGLPVAVGPLIAMAAAMLAPLLWQAPGQWPQWYSLLWAAAVATLVLSRPSHRALLAASCVAALGAATVVWGSASRGRVDLAERDVRGLAAPDAYASTLADRLARSLQGEELPRTPQALLERYVSSDLASAGYPVALVSWERDLPAAAFGTGPFDTAFDSAKAVVTVAEREGRTMAVTAPAVAYGVRIVAVPVRDGAVTIIVAPRTRLIPTDAYARWYGLASPASNEPPYTVQVVPEPIGPRTDVRWRREGTELHGDWPIMSTVGPARAHVEVDLRWLDTLVPRGGLLVIMDLAMVSLVWLLGALADGRAARWLRLRRRRLRSYRAQLSVALFLFFLVPAAAFAVWSWRQLYDDAQAARRLLVTETIRAFAASPAQDDALKREARRLDTKLLLYRSGVLIASSDSLFSDFVPMGQLLRPDVALQLGVSDEMSATKPEPLDGATGMLGYRVLPNTGGRLVLAAPARVDDFLLDRRRRDLGVLVLFASVLGAVAALWSSAIAARQLARPIGALREAARAVARGEREVPLPDHAASEFHPVFASFRAMAHDLGESRAALEEAKRRTDAVLRTVASGVVAVDESGRVILANPRAEALLGGVPPAGEPLRRSPATEVVSRVESFLKGGLDEDGFELDSGGRTLRGQLTRLARGGAVLTLDDVTELARAQRVLAWGEMARQVAHEIKNPLTPIRLGVQHLRRSVGRADFDVVLDQNVTRILHEIDRLDEIARAFSRYGEAPEARDPAEPTDVAVTVSDVVALETLGRSDIEWQCDVRGAMPFALTREDQLREVLLNLFENARHAGATRVQAVVSRVEDFVQIDVIDNGSGIGDDVFARIFEPHFSTRTSGSGLGLAITRRLVESWGGSVVIAASDRSGTTVRVSLRVS